MTDRTNDIATLITQLRVLGQLTRAEAQVARLRVTQASSDAVRAELRQNAADADERAARIAGTLHELGALPDPVTPLIGRVAALVRGALEQAQPLDEAVLGDLALEHQLCERARYVAALADAVGRPRVRELAEHLMAAHTETLQWLTALLADLGAGRPAALGASPLQQVAAQVTHAANAPARGALDTVADATVTVTDATGTAVAGTVPGATAAAGADTAAHALHRSADAAEEVADAADTAQRTADAAAAVEGVAGTTPAEPPISGFADLPAHAAVAALRALDDPRDVEAMREFEQAHGNRPAVVEAARLRAAALRVG